MKKLFVLMFIFISACSSLPRQYDGNLGYQIVKKENSSITVSNIQEHKYVRDSTEQKKIRNLCAKELGADKSRIQLKPLKRDVVPAEISMPTMIPTSVKTDTVSGAVDTHGTGYITDVTKKKTTIRKTKFFCTVK